MKPCLREPSAMTAHRNKPTALVVEDDSVMRNLIEADLTACGYVVFAAGSAITALDQISDCLPDIMIVDITLPGKDGLTFCSDLKSDLRTASIPVLILSACADTKSIVKGLECGAEDYITKPYNRAVLVARINRILERSRKLVPTKQILSLCGLTIDPAAHTVDLNGKSIRLTATEFQLLYCLISNPGQLFTRNELMELAWKGPTTSLERAVDFQVYSLRKKLGAWSARIGTVHGVGYKLFLDII